MKRLFLAALAALLAASAQAQVPSDTRSVMLVRLYDLDSSSNVYCYSIGKRNATSGGSVRGGDYASPLPVKTSGLDTVVLSVDSTKHALQYVGVGDIMIVVEADGDRLFRTVTAKASDDQVTVNEAWDLGTSSNYYFRDVNCTGSPDGSEAFIVRDLDNYQISVQVAQMGVDAGEINVSIQCRHEGGDFWDIETVGIAAGGTGEANFLTRVFEGETWEACRIALNVEDDDTDVVVEQINAWISGKGVVQ